MMKEENDKPTGHAFRIEITDGPYIVHGAPRLRQTFTVANSRREVTRYVDGQEFPMGQTAALCRCGASARKPFCDGAHLDHNWDPELTASEDTLLSGAEFYRGPELTLSDNREYCAYARFCDGGAGVWNHVHMNGEEAREETIRQASACPAGRLNAWDNETEKPYEPSLEPGLSLLEDTELRVSGPLYVMGGIPFSRQSDGFRYEVRNRVTLCRCGQSTNKPYCDGTHASMKFHDGLPKYEE